MHSAEYTITSYAKCSLLDIAEGICFLLKGIFIRLLLASQTLIVLIT